MKGVLFSRLVSKSSTVLRNTHGTHTARYSHTTSNLHEAEQNGYTIKHHKLSTLLSQNII